MTGAPAGAGIDLPLAVALLVPGGAALWGSRRLRKAPERARR
jgi:hypothetical protein